MSAATAPSEAFSDWIGRTEASANVVAAGPLNRLAATLDRGAAALRPGDAMPPGGHWLLFVPGERQSELGPDGHPRRGGFLPPVPLPRRMWAGGRIRMHEPLRVGDLVQRTSTIKDVKMKGGRSGRLCFVLVEHRLSTERGLAMVEEHDIVYRDPPTGEAGAPTAGPAAPAPDWQRRIEPDPVLLFRYSALTFNGHRIHYDRRYVTETEGYPGLVVHGPLQATLLWTLIADVVPQGRLENFAFRALRPVFDTASFTINGRRRGAAAAELWVASPDGAVCMEAAAQW